MSSPLKAEAYDKYQAEDDLRTIQSARRIEKDPKRMEAVKRAAKEKLTEMNDLKKLAGQ